MTISELLDAAKRANGSLGNVAEALKIGQSHLSNWRSGRSKPTATQIAMLAELASLPVFETVAQIESSLDDDTTHVWERALGKLRAAGVAASLTLILGTYLTTSNDARASTISEAQNGSNSTLSARNTLKTP